MGWPARSLSSFYRKSNAAACNGTTGSEMWFVKLNGPGSARVTYGVNVNGKPSDQTGTVRLVDIAGSNEQQLFCSKDGASVYEPFLISESVR